MTIVRWYLECSTFGLQNCGSVTVVLQLRVGFFTVEFKEEQGLTETQELLHSSDKGFIGELERGA